MTDILPDTSDVPSSHRHVVSFCGEPGCARSAYHANTEDLVSPALSEPMIAEYFADTADDVQRNPDYLSVTVGCRGRVCLNADPMWLYLRPDDPLMREHRPNHYDAGYFAGTNPASGIWAGRTDAEA